jgi:hypothetical protein
VRSWTGRCAEFGLPGSALLAGAAIEFPSAEAVELKAQFDTSPLGAGSVARTGSNGSSFLLAVDDVVLHGQINLVRRKRPLVLVDTKPTTFRMRMPPAGR